MARRTATEPAVDAWVANLARPQRDLVTSIRALIREAAPALEERIKWGQPCYLYGRANVCYIAPTADRVSFGFFHGADLDDPEHLLEGTGKDMRHVKVGLEKPVPRDALKALVRKAFALSRASP